MGLSLISPRHLIGPALQTWLPGFVWLTAPSFVLGLAGSYAYGWLIAGIWVPLYNMSANLSARRPEREQQHDSGAVAVGGVER